VLWVNFEWYGRDAKVLPWGLISRLSREEESDRQGGKKSAMLLSGALCALSETLLSR
jgi:hypothetical protein